MHSPSLAPSVCSCSGYCHFLSLFLLLFPAVSEGSAYLSRTNMLTMPYKCLSTKIQINPHTKMMVFIVSTDDWSLTSSRRPERWPERCASNLLIYAEWSAGFLLHRPVCTRACFLSKWKLKLRLACVKFKSVWSREIDKETRKWKRGLGDKFRFSSWPCRRVILPWIQTFPLPVLNSQTSLWDLKKLWILHDSIFPPTRFTPLVIIGVECPRAPKLVCWSPHPPCDFILEESSVMVFWEVIRFHQAVKSWLLWMG